MTNDQFAALVARLEEQAKRDPVRYRNRVLWLALMGNAYLWGLLLLVAATFVVLLLSVNKLHAFGAKLALIAGGFLWMLLKSLYIRVPPPEGIEITAKQAPELFALIDAMRKALQSPRFHQVLITDEFNAAVAQRPRFGIFGGYKNYLILGLPLMKTLTEEQFKAVLAHEFGHLSAGHGRLGNWIYRQRLRWAKLREELEAREGSGGFLLKPLLEHFAPYFHAYSFPLARSNEYQADATSGRLTSPTAAAEALTAVNVLGYYLHEQFWPSLHQQANHLPTPSLSPYTQLGVGLNDELPPASLEAWQARAMQRETSLDDTHPALKDRLAALGQAPRLQPPAKGQGADRLLGSVRNQILEQLDRDWQRDVSPSWEAHYRRLQDDRRSLEDFDQRVARGIELPADAQFQRAQLTHRIADDLESAISQLRALCSQEPTSGLYAYHLGDKLLQRDDDEGCDWLERAMALDADAILPACERLRDYHWRHEREEQAHGWHARLCQRQREAAAAEQERSQLHLNDAVMAHDLPAEQLQNLRIDLRSIPGIASAYLLRKQVSTWPEQPFYVLGYTLNSLFGYPSKDKLQQSTQALVKLASLPPGTLIINLQRDNASFASKFKREAAAQVL